MLVPCTGQWGGGGGGYASGGEGGGREAPRELRA
jgi:hypothetical protein